MKSKTEAKRQAILHVAEQVFAEFGFERASMAEICARMGGSKTTVYSYFPSKEVLFFAVMEKLGGAEFDAAHSAIAASTDDLAASLRHFGEKFLGFLYAPKMQAQRHLVIAAAARTELGRVVYEHGVLRSQKLVAEFLGAAMRQGKLREADLQVTTRHLYALLEAELVDRFLFQLPGKVSAKEIKAVTGRAIDVFMVAYGPRLQ